MPFESGVECGVAAAWARGERDAVKKIRTNVRMGPNDSMEKDRRNAEPAFCVSFLDNFINYEK
jgi:hypothetical protein